ncbi:MAG: hypothetical protein GY907_12225, partial [Bacteroidetes bacterium]|nr:hypothetical protein [Bacteroidota bacterium]
MAKEFYEVVFTTLDGNVIERDVKHFTDEREAIAFHNSLKDNDKVASAIIDKVYHDPKSFLSGRTETAYYANPIHKDYLNSRSGDKRFEDPEPIVQFLQRKIKARKEFALSPELNGMGLEEIYKDMNEFDDKSMKAYGDAMKVALGSGEKSTSIEKIYMDMLKNELPSQDEVNDAF